MTESNSAKDAPLFFSLRWKAVCTTIGFSLLLLGLVGWHFQQRADLQLSQALADTKGHQVRVLAYLVNASGADLQAVLTPFENITQNTLGILDYSHSEDSDTQLLWGGKLTTLNQDKATASRLQVLQAASRDHPKLNYYHPPVIVTQNGRHYAVSLIPVRGALVNGKQFVALSDITPLYQTQRQQLFENLSLIAAGLSGLGLLLFFQLWPLASRIRSQARLLPFLGQKQFQEARTLLPGKREAARIHNELDLLDEATTTLSFQLESLDKAIELRAKELERQSLFDAMTGVANRHLFQYELERDVAECRGKKEGPRIALILLDIDKFKRINDSLGHQQGDMLLGRVASRLKKATGSIGLCARLGGNEFAVLVRNVKTSARIEVLSQKILELVNRPITLDNESVVVSCSIGASLMAPNLSANDLVKNAEIAMYKAKDAGGHGYQLFNAKMAAETKYALSLESEIRRGFEDKEYTLYLQPKVNMENEIEGFEALIRWDHPDRGILPPDEFIPAMEEMGFIAQLDNLVLEASCRQLHVWKNHFPEKSLAVNISSTHFTNRNFLVFLQRCLKKYPIDPKKLELEITETLLMENMNAGLEVITQIKAMGVNIAIDDFGTGYSSLSYLKNLPVDTLKIDREFIKDIPESQSDMQISSVIIFLAKQLGFKVVAEGVETSEQLVFLKANHCDLAQGYYFSEPIPAHQAMVMLESQRLSSGQKAGGEEKRPRGQPLGQA